MIYTWLGIPNVHRGFKHKATWVHALALVNSGRRDRPEGGSTAASGRAGVLVRGPPPS